MITRIVLAGCVAVLTGCAGPQIYHAQLAALDKGMLRLAPESRKRDSGDLSTGRPVSGGELFRCQDSQRFSRGRVAQAGAGEAR